jgi:hypothetical protein
VHIDVAGLFEADHRIEKFHKIGAGIAKVLRNKFHFPWVWNIAIITHYFVEIETEYSAVRIAVNHESVVVVFLAFSYGLTLLYVMLIGTGKFFSVYLDEYISDKGATTFGRDVDHIFVIFGC